MARTAIFAGSSDEARIYARYAGLDERDILYVRGVRTLHKGYRVANTVVLPGFSTHRYASEIAAAAFN